MSTCVPQYVHVRVRSGTLSRDSHSIVEFFFNVGEQARCVSPRRRMPTEVSTLDDCHQLDSTRYIFSAKRSMSREVKREVATCAGGYREPSPGQSRQTSTTAGTLQR
jgi:hypothetical protein